MFYSINQIKKEKNLYERAKKSNNWLVDNGYIYNPVTGWEKLEVLLRFKLNPEMKSIPTQLYRDYEIKTKSSYKKGAIGKQQDIEIIEEKVYKNTYYRGASANFLAYYQWKKNKNASDMAESERLRELSQTEPDWIR